MAVLVGTGPEVAPLPAHDGLKKVQTVYEHEEIFPRGSEVKQAAASGRKVARGPPTLLSIRGRKAPFLSKTAPAPMRSEDLSTLQLVAATDPCQWSWSLSCWEDQ